MPTENTTDRTLFDGRIAKHKRIHDLWIAYHQHYFNDNFDNCLKLLDSLIVEIGSYINDDVKKGFLKRIDILRMKNSILKNSKVNKNNVSNANVSIELRNIADDITEASKKLYLPIEELGTGFDEEQFLRESG